jgi:hypothetical protein
MPHARCPLGHRHDTSPSQAQQQARSQAAVVLPPMRARWSRAVGAVGAPSGWQGHRGGPWPWQRRAGGVRSSVLTSMPVPGAGGVFPSPGVRARRCRVVVQSMVVPRALHRWVWHRVSRHGPRPTGRCGLWRPGGCPCGWRRSVSGRPGRPRQLPAPQHGAGGDGPQCRLFGRRGSVRCGPRLSLGVGLTA